MNDILEKIRFGTKTIEDCEKAFRITGLDKYETSKILEEWGQKEYDPYSIIYNVRMLDTLDEISDYYKKFTDALVEVSKEVHKRKLAKMDDDKKEKEKKKQDEDLEKLKEQMKKDEADRAKKLSDAKKKENDERKNNDQPESPSPKSPRPKEEPNPNLPKRGDTFDESSKKKYTQEAERELKKHNISDQKLNQKLGVDDWKVEMNKSVDWSSAQTFWFSIQDAIRKISKEIVCDMCKETASPILDYIALDKEGKKKKFCTWECQNAFKDKNKGVNKDDVKEIKKELQEIKDYLKKERVDANKMLNNLLAWMKKGGVINITLSGDKIVVELSGRKTKTIEESDLTSEQRVLKNYLQNNSGKKSINRSEIEKMISGNYNEERERNKKNGSGGIIAAIVVVGIVLAVVIGVVIHKNKRRDY